MAERVVMLDREDVEFIAGALRASKVAAAERVAATPSYMREARAGAEATRDRAARLALTLENARALTARIPEIVTIRGDE